MLTYNLCHYADAYIIVKGSIKITGAGDDDAAKRLNERNKDVIFKNCLVVTKCISRINNTDIDTAQDIDIVMSMYSLIEYSDNYSTTSGSLWQYYKDEPNNNLADSESFKSKVKITADINTNNVEIIVPLKYLSNFWRTLEMSLINCETELIFTWSKITETKLYVPVVTLSRQDNAKLLQKSKSDFKRTINWNKYESNLKTFAQNMYLNYLIKSLGSNQTFCIIF